jgi:glycosyltransferase involved in cell wall biosynthesis
VTPLSSPEVSGSDEPAPAVSVIVPAYNAGAEIAACIEAVLAQECPGRFEMVVADNGSTDRTRDVVAGYPVRLVSETTAMGSYAARNRGIEAARGAVLAFTDADCVPRPGWLAAGLAALEREGAGVVGGDVVAAPSASESERYLATRGTPSPRQPLAHPFRPFVPTANAFFRRAVFDRAGRFNATLISGGDADMCWRAAEAGFGAPVFAPEAVVEHRVRVTVSDLFRQHFKWGVGAGCLVRLYRDRMGARRHRILLGGLARVARAAGAVAWSLLTLPLTWPSGGRRGPVRLRNAWCDLGTALRWTFGYVAGRYGPTASRVAGARRLWTDAAPRG